eukprot:2056536-Rhodomonas_salina.1
MATLDSTALSKSAEAISVRKEPCTREDTSVEGEVIGQQHSPCQYPPKSNTRDRIPGSNCPENVVSCV